MRQVVLDASVILKWYLADETDGQKALGLLNAYISDELEVFSPSLLEYEVINGLFIAHKRGRMEKEKILFAIGGFIDLDITMKPLSDFYPNVLNYCRVYNLSVYDGSYLALADGLRIPFVTADRRLYHAVTRHLKWVKWLGDISI